MNIDLKSPESNESLMIISCETDPGQAGASRLRLCHGRGEEAGGGQFLLRDHLELTQVDVRCRRAETATGEHLEEFEMLI